MKQALILRNRHLFIFDAVAFVVLPIIALMLRLDGLGGFAPFLQGLVAYIALAMLVKFAVFYSFGFYRGYWRYASVEELLLVVKAVGVAFLIMLPVFFIIIVPLFLVPRSLVFVDFLLTILVVGGIRFSVRLLNRQPTVKKSVPRQRIVIFGAGNAGQLIARQIQQDPYAGFEVVGFIDDDPSKHGLRMHSTTVLGDRHQIKTVVQEVDVDHIVIAMPSAPGSVVREITNICKTTDASVRVLPGISELLNGSIGVERLRPVEIEDLLRRRPVQTDLEDIRNLLHNKVILVTGAGGSIGSELCRQIVAFQPAGLVLLGHGENSIFMIRNELVRTHPDVPLIPVIADVRDRPRLDQVMDKYRPQIVFHTAAHKHVPLMETNIPEAITNNVLGSYHLLESCYAHDVERFVLVSTDKAVNPTNIMGACKRLAELLVQDTAERSGRDYVAVRFGNVLGSRGSVVPFFKKQIERGGPVTVTHPDVERYFMTIPEAVLLVLQAATLGRVGDLFMLDMAEPVRIADLAEDLIRLSGYKPNEDIEIVYTGLRPGEKLQEELYQKDETYVGTDHRKILRVTTASRRPQQIHESIATLHMLAAGGYENEAIEFLASLIPEYRPSASDEQQALTQDAKPTTFDDLSKSARWY